MSPKDSINFLDRLSVKILLVLASLVIGYSTSALWISAQSVTNIFIESGVPKVIVLALPMSLYITTCVLFDRVVSFKLREWGLGGRRALVNKTKTQVARLRKDLVPAIPEEHQKTFAPILERMAEAPTLAKTTLDKFERDSQSLQERKQVWLDGGAHVYFVSLITQFVCTSLLIGAVMLYRLEWPVLVIGLALIHARLFYSAGSNVLWLIEVAYRWVKVDLNVSFGRMLIKSAHTFMKTGKVNIFLKLLFWVQDQKRRKKRPLRNRRNAHEIQP